MACGKIPASSTVGLRAALSSAAEDVLGHAPPDLLYFTGSPIRRLAERVPVDPVHPAPEDHSTTPRWPARSWPGRWRGSAVRFPAPNAPLHAFQRALRDAPSSQRRSGRQLLGRGGPRCSALAEALESDDDARGGAGRLRRDGSAPATAWWASFTTSTTSPTGRRTQSPTRWRSRSPRLRVGGAGDRVAAGRVSTPAAGGRRAPD